MLPVAVAVMAAAGCGSETSRPHSTPTATAIPPPTQAPWTPVAYELVAVGDPGNAADLTGYGAVAYAYRIGKYEVTIGQYAAFLNAVAAADPHGLYMPAMAGDPTVAGIVRSGSDGHYTYAVTGPFGSAPPGAASGSDRPIAYISWFAAARFANWMANGQPRGVQDATTTENGAYDLTDATAAAVARNDINPNTGAAPLFRIPTENEWYKAAYYDPSRNEGSGGYWLFATRSDTPPGNTIGGEPNQANYIVDVTGYSIYSVTQASDLDTGQNHLSDVGAFGASASAYGTYDQNGNLWEWNDIDGRAGPYRGLRGGAWTSTSPYLQSTLRLGYGPTRASSNSGFRLASPSVGPTTSAEALSYGARAHAYDASRAEPRGVRRPGTAMDDPSLRNGAAGEPIAMPMVTVGDAGNPDDVTGFGGVSHDYAIAMFDVTIGDYAAFLNAVAAADPHALYNPRMATDTAVAGIARTGSPGDYRYSVIDNGGSSAERPITYVSWWDAARFANWMANGQPSGEQDDATTEDGAYALHGATSGIAVARNAVNPNTGSTPAFYLPLENEWYKAAYYDPSLAAGAGGYYDYAAQSDAPPGNTIGSEANQANYFAGGVFAVTGSSAQEPNQNYLTDVGTFAGSRSHYGTFDQNGNVWQWNDLDGTPSASRGLRGGYWFSGSLALEATLFCNDTPARESNDTGFRLAGPPPSAP
jgi:sulfatase modifying factor 1